MLVLFIDAHFNCFCLCEHGIYYLVEVLHIPLGIGSRAPSVKCVFFFVMLYVRGNYGQFVHFVFFEKPRVTCGIVENSSILVQKGIISLSLEGTEEGLACSVEFRTNSFQNLVCNF